MRGRKPRAAAAVVAVLFHLLVVQSDGMLGTARRNECHGVPGDAAYPEAGCRYGGCDELCNHWTCGQDSCGDCGEEKGCTASARQSASAAGKDATSSCTPFLSLSADGRRLVYGDAPAPFLNGVNIAWIQWGSLSCDEKMEEAVRFVVANGGNSIRVWMFSEPKDQLEWDEPSCQPSRCRVRGLAAGFVRGAQTLLELARSHGVSVVFVRRTLALMPNPSPNAEP